MVMHRMARARAGLVVVLLAGGIAAAAAACFPDYAVGGDEGGAVGPDAGDSGSADGTTTGEGARTDSATGADSMTGVDSTTGVDSGRGADSGTTDATLGGDGASMGDGSAADSGAAMDSSPPISDASYDGNPLSNMVIVDGGTFYFQVDSLGSGSTDAQATLDYTVAIDRTEVTVGQFTTWVNMGRPLPCAGCSLDPSGPYKAVMTWDPASWSSSNADILNDIDFTDAGTCSPGYTSKPILTYGTNANYPITCVPWPQALAFCAWEGKRLPTDTEWRYFATGRGTQAPYPWGASPVPDCSHAIGDFDDHACGFPVVVGSASAGASRDGVQDLVGSLSEWVWDWLANPSYGYPANAGVDYAGPDAGSGPNARVWMDSDYTEGFGGPYTRFHSTLSGPTESSAFGGYDNCGFRCAKSLP